MLLILIYGLLLAFTLVVLKYFEYRYVQQDLTTEVYLGIVALIFSGLGIWMGRNLTNRKPEVDPVEAIDTDLINFKSYGLSHREYEVLQFMALGLTNQEIADKLFISLPTVKSHSSKLFRKLNVKRRTQAVMKGKELNLLS